MATTYSNRTDGDDSAIDGDGRRYHREPLAERERERALSRESPRMVSKLYIAVYDGLQRVGKTRSSRMVLNRFGFEIIDGCLFIGPYRVF